MIRCSVFWKRARLFGALISFPLLSQLIVPPSGFSSPLASSRMVSEENPNNAETGLTLLSTQLNYFKMVPPVYPKMARQKGWQGTVVLKALVAEDGTCSRVEVEESSGYDALDQSAVHAVRQWEFSPARLGGNPYAVLTKVPVQFILTDEN